MAIPFSSLSLFPANKEQIIESRTRSYASWGRGTTLEQYLARDARSDNHEVSINNRLTTWVLARRDSPDSLDFLCSIETFLREGLVARAATRVGEENTVEKVHCYGIASAFTPERNRGHGYALHMMRLLHWVIGRRGFLPVERFPAEWGSPPERPSYMEDGEFAVLWSDVGTGVWSMTGPTGRGDGFPVREPISTLWNVEQAHAHLSASTTAKKQEWQWLDKDAINDAWRADADLMKRELATEPATHPIAFTCLPTRGVAEFQFHRLEQFWSKMDPVPIHWGICAKTSSDSSIPDVATFASWTVDFRPPVSNRLVITRLRTSPENFEELLFQIIDFAKRHSVNEVEVWGLPEKFRGIAEGFKGKTFERDEHLSSFKFYGPGGSDLTNVAWAYNEMFCWC